MRRRGERETDGDIGRGGGEVKIGEEVGKRGVRGGDREKD